VIKSELIRYFRRKNVKKNVLAQIAKVIKLLSMEKDFLSGNL